MAAFIVTIALLALALWWLHAWMGHSRLALGVAIGVALATFGGPAIKALVAMEHMRLWLPALPFALVATTLFVFGILAWIWADD